MVLKTVRITIGGGESWYYALQDGKVLGAAHRDDADAMQRLRDIQKANAEALLRRDSDVGSSPLLGSKSKGE
jgi:hypothetical protein